MIVERKRPSFLCMLYGSALTFTAFALVVVVILLMGPVFIYFFLSFQYFCVSVYALGFGFTFRINETEVNVVHVSIGTTENYDVDRIRTAGVTGSATND